MGAGDIISPGNQILALTAKKAIPKSATIANGKIFVLIKPKESKLINVGNQLTRLPKELKNIESSKRRKNLFIQIVLPLIIEENLKIRFD